MVTGETMRNAKVQETSKSVPRTARESSSRHLYCVQSQFVDLCILDIKRLMSM